MIGHACCGLHERTSVMARVKPEHTVSNNAQCGNTKYVDSTHPLEHTKPFHPSTRPLYKWFLFSDSEQYQSRRADATDKLPFMR